MLPMQPRYCCSVCQQTFSRNEHLLRHQVKRRSAASNPIRNLTKIPRRCCPSIQMQNMPTNIQQKVGYFPPPHPKWFALSIKFNLRSHSDALKRHESVHQPLDQDCRIADALAKGSPERKTRASAACDRCAKAKIRCNGKIPCDPCLARYKVCTLDRPHSAIKRRCPLPSPPCLDLSFDHSVAANNEFRNPSDQNNSESHLASPVSRHQTHEKRNS